MWKIMQDDAIWTARIHPGNRDEVFIWQNFQLAYRDLGNRASGRPFILLTHREDLEVRRDLGNRWFAT